jgi:nicotinate phosphoribosyltransferase
MEGDLVFPIRPVLQVEADIIEAQIIETLLLNMLNFQTLIATKASRMRQVAGGRSLIDFGLRRAQGPGGYYASRAAFIGGFDGTSNMRAGRDYGIPVSGTMAHSFIQSYDDELTAFLHFSEVNPVECVLVLDTYDTLKSGLPNAIAVAKKMEEKNMHLSGIRLDSGDLAYLSKECRRRLDSAGLNYVKIAVSNQLDEYIIKSLLDQDAPIDSFGVGTNLVTGHPDSALDGVYKLSFANGKPRIKLSENVSKITLPHQKQVFRMVDNEDKFIGADAIAMSDEQDLKVMHHPLYPLKSLSLLNMKKQPLLNKVMENGLRLNHAQTISQIASFSKDQLARLPAEFKRFDYPHIYKVGISARLQTARDRLINEFKK